MSKSIATTEAFGKKLLKLRFFLRLILVTMFGARELSMERMSIGFGLPRSSRILSTWLSVEVPGKMALPLMISPKVSIPGTAKAKLTEDAADRPHVDRLCVLVASEDDFWRSVPTGGNVFRLDRRGSVIALVLSDGAG